MFPIPPYSRFDKDYYKSKCPYSMCPGRIVHIRCTITNQIIMACEECLTYFAGQSPPTFYTPCESWYRYNNMLGIDESSWEVTHEKPTKEWDMVTYFKKINSQSHTPLSIPSNNIICPFCGDRFKFRMRKDERGCVYRVDEPKFNSLRILQISPTNRLIQHCRYCDSIWPAYQEPELNNSGGRLRNYLALLGIIISVTE